jgi:hypothetical protein
MFALLKLPPGSSKVERRVAPAGESEASASRDARTRVLMEVNLSGLPLSNEALEKDYQTMITKRYLLL